MLSRNSYVCDISATAKEGAAGGGGDSTKVSAAARS